MALAATRVVSNVIHRPAIHRGKRWLHHRLGVYKSMAACLHGKSMHLEKIANIALPRVKAI